MTQTTASSPATEADDRRLTPRVLLRAVSIGEAITWALLLTGMFLKYVTQTTDLLVSVGGSLHGAMFMVYLVVTAFVGINQRWPWWMFGLGWFAAIPPFATLVYDWWAERRGALEGGWRDAPANGFSLQRIVRWFVDRPITMSVAVIVLAVVILTGSLSGALVGPTGTH
ncbi:hypothetical protein C5B85_14575 [Pseudoclavibacter sp. AY1F1]|uniref:DUF3817 domain-containing protein n=1 Tax=Pseudoclavibacter sp. AY1F1 TaxID=2080583 RepID=UPI000CE7CDBE|nr:DUF3817 domain-containing protein [Pseudoclavibacter sp. AY1F1]PPF43170.1 hypothetical protein C5B85_14575 [Pseudoclavibacter sp. AY1F1]